MLTNYFERAVLSFLLILLACSFPLIASSSENDDARRYSGNFLHELTAAAYNGMGGSFIGSVAGARSINSNPAGLAMVDKNKMELNLIRFSRTVAAFSKLNNAGKYEDHSQYDLPAYGLEVLNYEFPLGKIGTIGFNFVFRHEGQFSRVNNEGKAVNTVPENDFAFTLGYGKRIAPGAYLGVDSKLIRSKVQDVEGGENIGRGYAYNIGFIQHLNEHWRLGGVVQNLSNGLSFANEIIPDKLRREFIVGVAYQQGSHQHSQDSTFINLGLDFHFPSTDGIRANAGGELWYRQRIGFRLGYMRHIQQRFEPVINLNTDEVILEERLWITEGMTYGLGLRLHKWEFNFAYTPQHKPQAKDTEKIRIEKGNAIISFSLSLIG